MHWRPLLPILWVRCAGFHRGPPLSCPSISVSGVFYKTCQQTTTLLALGLRRTHTPPVDRDPRCDSGSTGLVFQSVVLAGIGDEHDR